MDLIPFLVWEGMTELNMILGKHTGKYLVSAVNPAGEDSYLRLGGQGPADAAGPRFRSSNRQFVTVTYSLLSTLFSIWASSQCFFKHDAVILMVTWLPTLRTDVCWDTLVFTVIRISC